MHRHSRKRHFFLHSNTAYDQALTNCKLKQNSIDFVIKSACILKDVASGFTFRIARGTLTDTVDCLIPLI